MLDNVKGINLGIDAIRYGTGAFVVSGDVSSPATFQGFADDNDTTTHRWGILANVPGGLEFQGGFAVGRHPGGSTDHCYFKDANINITLTDTPFTESGYTHITIEHNTTMFDIRSVNFTTVGTVNPGYLEFINYYTSGLLKDCNFCNFGATQLKPNVVCMGTRWRQCDRVIQSGALICSGVISEGYNSIAVKSDDPENIYSMQFVSDGTGHAVEIRPIGSGPFEFDWYDNGDSGYASSDGSTGNETILIHPETNSANVTLNIVGGSTTPSVMEHADYTGTFTKVINPVTLTITTRDASDNSLITGARVLVIADTGGDLPSSRAFAAGQLQRIGSTVYAAHAAGHGFETGDKVLIEGANEDGYNGVHTVTYLTSTTYTYTISTTPASPATGSPTDTAVIIDETTDESGQADDTRSYTSSQPITGRARKSSSFPYYKTSSILGTISNTAGLSLTVQLIPDN
jgi:hypothetical protein